MESNPEHRWTCFECGAPLARSQEAACWTCHAGHEYSSGMMLEDGGNILERVLRAAVIALEDGSEIALELQAPVREHVERIRAIMRERRQPESFSKRLWFRQAEERRGA